MVSQGTVRKRKQRPPVEVQVALEAWGPRGAALAAAAGRNIPVDRGIPGETVIAGVERGRRPRGVVKQVIQASPSRVEPPCPFYLQGCGGCQWQHVSYRAQLESKYRLVDAAMLAAGTAARVQHVTPAPFPWRYRRTAAIALGWEAGFHPRGRRGIVEIDDCLIAHPLLGKLAADLNGLLATHSLPNYHGKVWLDTTVVGSRTEPGLQILLQGIAGLAFETHPELPEVAATIAALPGVETVAYRQRSGKVFPLVGELLSPIEIAGRYMHLPAGSFCQTNLEMVEVVLGRMRDALRGRHVRSAADIYGGIGTFGLHLAPLVDEMTLIELDPLAVEAARHTAQEWGMENVRFVDQHAERALPEIPALDLAIVDPPRCGLGESVVESLDRNGVPLILYVSCSPSSLALDLAGLEHRGYRVRELGLYDFYPQTYHVESLAVLER